MIRLNTYIERFCQWNLTDNESEIIILGIFILFYYCFFFFKFKQWYEFWKWRLIYMLDYVER